MSTQIENNKRIAKNTLFMYFRMLLTMVVSLYTSRVVLKTLGVQDFGIYNIVGGVVVLFTFINSAMSTGTQRHLSYELGKPEGNISKVFSACLFIHISISIIIFILAETIGLWFLNTHMNLPSYRMGIVNWVYQFSILGCISNIIRIPYQASIIAHEKMSFYAYTGIVEVVLKLAIVFLLIVLPMDKLLVYSALMFCVITIITAWFILFNKNKFPEIKIIKVKDIILYKTIISFSGWTLFGSTANLGLHQGMNVIINIFYGVTVNAAIGIANQVNAAITHFVTGFQQALNPQLVKSEAQNDKARQLDLICKSSKLSYLILLLISIPIIFNIEYILELWLSEYPEHTPNICRLIILGALVECLSGPLWVTIFATGKIKTYQIIISIVLLLNIPVSLILGYYNQDVEIFFLARNFIYILGLCTRLYFLAKLIKFDIKSYFKRVILPVIITTVLIILPIYMLIIKISLYSTHVTFIIQSFIIVIYEIFIIYIFALDHDEKAFLIKIIQNKLKK